jgi:hypothetical protein
MKRLQRTKSISSVRVLERGPDGFSAHGALVVFELDTAGKVQQVKVGEMSFYPQTEW